MRVDDIYQVKKKNTDASRKKENIKYNEVEKNFKLI